ncbi:ABC transporter substrate-binding protein, partial [Microbacteriaceae bacterium K1510]|nr:ABC transporter substrate-binding protein [Microbacteriaceae bacterium K1510]
APSGFLAVVLSVGMVVAGCGGAATSSGGSAPTSSSSGSSSTASSEKILIATQTPLSGSQSAIGDAIKSGAELALNEQKEEFKKLGFDLQLFPQDDQGDPKIGVANAEMLVANPDVFGVMGHYNTGVAIPSSVKYEEGKLVMVAPANT